jgi:hypothetical protein
VRGRLSARNASARFASVTVRDGEEGVSGGEAMITG